jgi:hypothetical protein
MEWKDVLAKFVEAFLLGIAPIIASFVAAWLFAKAKKAIAEMKVINPDLYWALEEVAAIAVKAAEQAQLAGFVTDKKAYAIGVVEKLLALRGFVIDLDPISDAIEAAVWEEFNKKTKG